MKMRKRRKRGAPTKVDDSDDDDEDEGDKAEEGEGDESVKTGDGLLTGPETSSATSRTLRPRKRREAGNAEQEDDEEDDDGDEDYVDVPAGADDEGEAEGETGKEEADENDEMDHYDAEDDDEDDDDGNHAMSVVTVEPEPTVCGIRPSLKNVVAAFDVGCPIALDDLACRLRNAEYNPGKYSACILRLPCPKTTGMVYSSGKMTVAGARSIKDCRLAARKFTRLIQLAGTENVTFKSFKIVNMVASCDVKFPIDLEALEEMLNVFEPCLFNVTFPIDAKAAADVVCKLDRLPRERNASFEPEIFPALIYRMASPQVLLHIFVSGSVVLTGFRNRHCMRQALANMFPLLEEFRKGGNGRVLVDTLRRAWEEKHG